MGNEKIDEMRFIIVRSPCAICKIAGVNLMNEKIPSRDS